MEFSLRKCLSGLVAFLAALAAVAALSSFGDCSQPNTLQSASGYGVGWRDKPNYKLLIDVWTRNPKLEAFIRNAIQEKVFGS